MREELDDFPPMKTVTVSLALRVPRNMRKDDIENFLASAIASEPGSGRPDSNESFVLLYRGRIEVFMP